MIKNQRITFINKIEKLKKLFEETVIHFEQTHLLDASKTAKEIYEELSNTLKDIHHDYLDAIYSNKLPSFSKDQKKLEDFKEQKATNQENAAFMELLERMMEAILVVEKEIKRLYPAEPYILSMMKKHWKWTAGLAIFGILGLSIFGSWAYLTRKQGLLGQYYQDMEFKTFYRQQVDKTINFDWGLGSPFSNWRSDYFSISWTGFIFIPQDGKYDFFTRADDGVILSVDKDKTISDWMTHSIQENQGSLILKRGYHSIYLQYFEYDTKAAIQLLWKPPFESSKQIIPPKYLVPSAQDLEQGEPIFGTQN